MRRWDLSVALDPGRGQPLFLQLAGAIADEIRSGRLRPGDALPGTRELAARLGINRNTVVSGYGELAAEGLVGARIGGGTFVLPQATHDAPRPIVSESGIPTYAMKSSLASAPAIAAPLPGALTLAPGGPDPRLFPARALARAFRRAIGPRGRIALGAPDPCGHVRLRCELASMLARSRGLAVTSDNLMVTRSIEQAIDLVARTLLAPGDAVVVEEFGYPPAWSVLKLAGAELLPLPLDADGLDVSALEQLLSRRRIRAVFLTPHHQFPTTVVMSHSRSTLTNG